MDRSLHECVVARLSCLKLHAIDSMVNPLLSLCCIEQPQLVIGSGGIIARFSGLDAFATQRGKIRQAVGKSTF